MKRVLRVYKKTVSIVNETATEMYKNFVGKQKGFLLESYDKNYDTFTIFGANPEEIITSEGQSLVVTKADGSVTKKQGNPHQLLKEYFDMFDIRKDNHSLPFSGGLVGNLGYDYIRYTEMLPDDNPDDIGIETIQMMLMTRFIVLDHFAETMTAVVLGEDSAEGRAASLLEAADMLKKARTKTTKEEQAISFEQDGIIVHKTDSLEEYGDKVEQIRHYIREGHIFQTVLSQRWTIQTKQDGFSLYEQLRRMNPSPYLYYYNYGDFEVIGSSPEMIVKQQGERVFTCPIAGPRNRG